jgi:EAL domain-containing protein (putative c-di-GMP-specific phosphodiesterase class I)/CheY-like chemotaxis protein
MLAQGSFDLMVLDCLMPGLSGIDVLRRVRANHDTATLPVVLVTGADAVADRVAGLRAGANDYVVKPYDVDELLARVAAQLNRQEAWHNVVEAHLRERGTIIQALAGAATQRSAEGVAAAICEELAQLRSITGVAIVAFTADGIALPLASGPGPVWSLRTNEPVPPPLARYLCLRAEIGPWIERGDAGSDGTAGLLAWGTVACAPIQDNGELLGLMLLAVGDQNGDASSRDASAALSAAIDFSGVASGLLTKHLTERRADEADRLGIASILLDETFDPHFQPIVRLADTQPLGTEALTRFRDGSDVEGRFRQAAICGLGLELELATIRRALAESGGFDHDLFLSLNVSPSLILRTPLLIDALAETTRTIVLEITEQEAIHDYAAVRGGLRRLGADIQLSVDDAGSGFASLRHVLLLQPAFIKLDRSWVRGVDEDPARQALIAGLQHFAAKTSCSLIAEGIETDAERRALIDLGVDLGQGFLLGRPARAPLL